MNMPAQIADTPAAAPAALPALLSGLLQSVSDARSEFVSVKDAAGRYVHVNQALADFFGCAAGEVVGRSDGDLLESGAVTALRAADQMAWAQAAPLQSEHRIEWRGVRREFIVWRSASPPDAQGRRFLCALWTDLGERRQREAQLRAALDQIEQQQRANDQLRREVADRALREPVSGLHRRGHFEDQLRREVDLSTREHREFAIVLIHVDAAGDGTRALTGQGRSGVLEAMGRLLRGGTRAMDAACHYDDERFAVLLSGVGLATAHARMEGLRRQCAVQIVVQDGREFGFTVSVGVASFPHTAHSQDALIAACESALAEARRRGGNQVTLAAISFDPP